MTSPQDDPTLIHKLAAMTDAEFNEVVHKARGTTRDVKKLIEREANKLGWQPVPPIPLNSDQIERRALGD
jgi:hypothetical protein